MQHLAFNSIESNSPTTCMASGSLFMLHTVSMQLLLCTKYILCQNDKFQVMQAIWTIFLNIISLILTSYFNFVSQIFFPLLSKQNKKQFSFLALECKEVLLEQQQLTATIMIILQTVIIRERLIMALGFRRPKLPLLLFLQP